MAAPNEVYPDQKQVEASEQEEPVSKPSVDDLVEKAMQYTPAFSMKTRRVLYIIAAVLLVIDLLIDNISKRGVGIPALVMGVVDTIPQVVSILVLMIAYSSNRSDGTLK